MDKLSTLGKEACDSFKLSLESEFPFRSVLDFYENGEINEKSAQLKKRILEQFNKTEEEEVLLSRISNILKQFKIKNAENEKRAGDVLTSRVNQLLEKYKKSITSSAEDGSLNAPELLQKRNKSLHSEIMKEFQLKDKPGNEKFQGTFGTKLVKGMSDHYASVVLPNFNQKLEGRPKIVKTSNICQQIGFNCEFKAEGKKEYYLEAHLRASHGALVHAGSEIVLLQEYLQPSSKLWRFASDMVWSPVVLHAEKTFLILSYVNGMNNTISWIPLLLDDDEENGVNYQAEFSISSPGDNPKEAALCWKQNCEKYLNAEVVLRTKPFQIPLSLLSEKYWDDNQFRVKVNIRKYSEKEVDPSKKDGNSEEVTTTCSPVEFYPVLKTDEEKGTVFHSYTCDKCSLTPVTGFFFMCLQCKGFLLCKDCFSPSIHAFHIFALVQSDEQRKLLRTATDVWEVPLLKWGSIDPGVHSSIQGNNSSAMFTAYYCDGCKCKPIVGIRLRCLQCVNFDLCKTCADLGLHSHHVFAVVMNLFQHKFMRELAKTKSPIIAAVQK